MRDKKDTRTMSLLDFVDADEETGKVNPETCVHRDELDTDTDWGPPYGVRMTKTCLACGQIRGRAQ